MKLLIEYFGFTGLIIIVVGALLFAVLTIVEFILDKKCVCRKINNIDKRV